MDEGGCLESSCTCKGTGGSNPSPTARKENKMFDMLMKKLQKMEKDVLVLCEMENLNAGKTETLYKILSDIEDLKGAINELEEMVLEEDSWMDNTNIES